jgi:tetratricopeptide (TPR) repeat protein
MNTRMKRTARFPEQISSCCDPSTAAPGASSSKTHPRNVPSVHKWRTKFLVPAIASLALLTGLSGCAKLQARDQLNKGVQAFKGAKYEEAIDHFQRATTLDPSLEMAKTYLATAYASSVIPGSDTAENKKNAQMAINSYEAVLAKDPKDMNATKGIASIYFNINQPDQAKAWQKKVLDVDPNDPEALYTIAVIDWTKSRKNAVSALTAIGSNYKADGNPQLPKGDCQKLLAVNGPLNEEALASLNKAVQVRPNYDDAMAYLSLEYLEKATTDCGDDAARKADLATAHEWVQKNMDTRKANEQKALQAAPAGVKMNQ